MQSYAWCSQRCIWHERSISFKHTDDREYFHFFDRSPHELGNFGFQMLTHKGKIIETCSINIESANKVDYFRNILLVRIFMFVYFTERSTIGGFFWLKQHERIKRLFIRYGPTFSQILIIILSIQNFKRIQYWEAIPNTSGTKWKGFGTKSSICSKRFEFSMVLVNFMDYWRAGRTFLNNLSMQMNSNPMTKSVAAK